MLCWTLKLQQIKWLKSMQNISNEKEKRRKNCKILLTYTITNCCAALVRVFFANLLSSSKIMAKNSISWRQPISAFYLNLERPLLVEVSQQQELAVRAGLLQGLLAALLQGCHLQANNWELSGLQHFINQTWNFGCGSVICVDKESLTNKEE